MSSVAKDGRNNIKKCFRGLSRPLGLLAYLGDARYLGRAVDFQGRYAPGQGRLRTYLLWKIRQNAAKNILLLPSAIVCAILSLSSGNVPEEGESIRATIKTIAERVGMSKSAVARALNDEYGISSESREKVLLVAKEMGYQPNSLGKALRTSRQAIRFAVIVHQNSFSDVVRAGMRQACQELNDFGVELLFFDYNKMNYQEQLQLLYQLPLQSISGIIIKPINHPQIREELNKLSLQGIPVVAVNSDIEECEHLCYVGQNLQRGGEIAGHLVGMLLGGAGNVVVFQEDDEGSMSFSCRATGLREELFARYPGICAKSVVAIHENAPANYQIALDYIETHPELRGICVIGSSHTEIAKALRDSGHGQQIKMVCFDIFSETRGLVKDGIIDFVITQSPITQGRLAVKTLFDYVFSGIQPPKKKLYVPTRIKESYTLEE